MLGLKRCACRQRLNHYATPNPLLQVMVSIFHSHTTTTTTVSNHQKHGNIWKNIHWLFLVELKNASSKRV